MLGRDGGRADDDLRAVRLEHVALVLADLVGADEDAVVAARLGDHGQPDAGVARGRLDDRAAGLQRTGGLGGVDHPRRDPVLHRAAGVEVLHLGEHAAGRARRPPSGRSSVPCNRTSGVLPMRSSSDSTYSMRVNIAALRRTLDIGDNGPVDVDSPASRTALGAARHRAVHQLLEGGSILHDPLAVRVTGDDPDDLVARARERGDHRMRWFVCARSRFAEQVLADAVAGRGRPAGGPRRRPRHLRLPQPVRRPPGRRGGPSGHPGLEARAPGRGGDRGSGRRRPRRRRLRAAGPPRGAPLGEAWTSSGRCSSGGSA